MSEVENFYDYGYKLCRKLNNDLLENRATCTVGIGKMLMLTSTS